MQVPPRPGLQTAGGRWAPWDSPPAAFPSPPQMLAANSSSAVCQTAMGPGGSALMPPPSSPSPYSLPRAPRLESPSFSVLEPPALLEPGFWSLQKGNDSEPALSALCIFLGPGKGPPLSLTPSSLRPYTGTLRVPPACLTPAGTGSLGSQRAEPRRGPAWPAVAH